MSHHKIPTTCQVCGRTVTQHEQALVLASLDKSLSVKKAYRRIVETDDLFQKAVSQKALCYQHRRHRDSE